MASGAQQLQNDFEQVTKLLKQYPNIKILQTKGDPPESYDIEYDIKGYKSNPDGSASPDNVHQIRITLPFGYPHFPPTAKPLTPIFHPDIDPDAIRIADFWGAGKSLSDLILHIGRMICGEIYSSEEPFNQRAFDWYEERKTWMPFDILEPQEARESDGRNENDQTTDAGPDDFDLEAAGAEEPADDDFSFDLDDLDNLDTTDEEENPLDFDLSEEPAQSFELEGLDDLDDLGDLGDLGELDTADEEAAPVDFDLKEEPVQSVELEGLDDLDDLDDLGDLGATDEEEAPIGVDLEEEPAQSDELGGLDDLPAEETGDSSQSIELGDLADLEADTATDNFEFPEEPSEQETEGIQLDDLAGLEENDAPESTDFGDEIAGLEALETLDEEQPGEEDMVDFSGMTDEPDSGSEDEPSGGDGEELDDIGLQLDDGSSARQGGESQTIRSLIENKEIFSAKKVIDDLADPGAIPDLKELELTVSAAISEAEELYKKADKLEQKGQLEKAGLVLDLVANVATDYPGLELARNRIRESKVTEDQEKEEAIRAEREIRNQTSLKARLKLPYKSIAVVLVLAIVGGIGFKIYMDDSENILSAESNVINAEQLVKEKEFKQAKKHFDDAQTALDKITILKKDARKHLQKRINDVVNSQTFKEGLQGKVLYEGEYITVEEAKALDGFKKRLKNADMILRAGNTEQALKVYEEAISYAEKAGLKDEAQNLRQTVNNLVFQQTLAAARKAEEEKEWKQAADTYKKALELSSTLAEPENQEDISQRLAAAAFRHDIDESKRAFTASEWEKTIEVLQNAQEILAKNPKIASKEEKAELSRILVNSRLYQILSVAKKAFEKNIWDLAVQKYRDAIELLDANTSILGAVEAAEGKRTIEKTILMTQLAKEQHLTTAAMVENDLQSTLTHYQNIVDLIKKSDFRDDATLRKILTNASEQTVNIERELFVNRRLDWLTEHYEEIFRENYPSAKSSELVNPKVSFIRQEGNIMIFTMSCVEKKQGRAFRLELNYQYDTDKDSWKLYSGKL